MKRIILLAGMACYALVAFPQQSAPEPDSAYFVVLYTIGEGWDTTKGAMDQPYFKEHAAHLQELRKANLITIGARYSRTGMIILRAGDEEEARALITDDIAIRNKLFNVEIFALDPFYPGCVE